MILSIQLYNQDQQLLTDYSLILLETDRVVDSKCKIILEAFEGGLEVEQNTNSNLGLDFQCLLTNGDVNYPEILGFTIPNDNKLQTNTDYQVVAPSEYTFTVKGEDLRTGMISEFKRRLVISVTDPKRITRDRIRSRKRHRETVVTETKLIHS